MTWRKTTLAVTAALVLIAAPGFAQHATPVINAGNMCSPEGVWYGSNALGESYIITITRIGAGRYITVSHGLTDTNFCSEATPFKGEISQAGPNAFAWNQIAFCDAYGPVLFWASSGQAVFTGCDHFDVQFDTIGAYYWGTVFTPFTTPFDIPLVAPPADPVPGSYDRMPRP